MHGSTNNRPNGSSEPDSISSSLLGHVRAQQPEAWRQLVQLFGPVVYGWCRQSGVGAADAADVAQETFRAVAGHIADFRRDRPGDSFRGWLWTIARNKIRDHFRRLQDLPAAEGGTEAQHKLAQGPDRSPEPSSFQRSADGSRSFANPALERVRAEFEPRTWLAFWRTTVDQQPAAAVAEELGMTPAAVYQAKSRVMRRIRRELGDLPE